MLMDAQKKLRAEAKPAQTKTPTLSPSKINEADNEACPITQTDPRKLMSKSELLMEKPQVDSDRYAKGNRGTNRYIGRRSNSLADRKLTETADRLRKLNIQANQILDAG